MRNDQFKNFLEVVKDAGENDPIWYAGYMWINLTPTQVDKVGTILAGRKHIGRYLVGNAGFERSVLIIPSGLKIYTNEKQVMKDVKQLLEGTFYPTACQMLLEFYNADLLTCGEYNKLYDWIQTHTDGNGRVSMDW